LPFPEGAIARDPVGGLFERPRSEVAAVDPAVFFPREQSGVFENSDMF